MLLSTHYAASRDETRFILNGVLLSFKGGKLAMVATDGRRMAMWEQELEIARDMEGEWVVPSKTVNELLKSLKDEGIPEDSGFREPDRLRIRQHAGHLEDDRGHLSELPPGYSVPHR
jgi:DNA polymerase III sliding clamp (beta) subunit (PCNA family)